MQFVPQALKTAIAIAIGSGAVLAASTAQAAPVLTATNIVAPATTAGIYINVLTLATGVTQPSVPGWDINPWGGTAATPGIAFFNSTNPAGTGTYVTSALNVVSNLPLGSVIGAANTFGSGSAANSSQWVLNSSNNYFGFRFLNEGNSQLHYGYAQLQFGASLLDRRVVAIAYESIPGASITVAAIPEPGTYALMGLGMAGVLLAARRRKQQA